MSETGVPELRGVVDFPEAGEGVYLQFKTSALMQIQAKLGKEWAEKAVSGLDIIDWDVIRILVAAGAKRDEAKVVVNLEGVDMIATDLRNRIRDALWYGMHGLSFTDYVDKLMAEQAKLAGEQTDSPPKGLEAISND